MKKNNVSIAVGGILIVMFVCLLFFFQVRTTEVAVVTRFGRIARSFTDQPGIHLRFPWPIENVYRFENRLQSFEKKFESTYTLDGKMILATVFIGWRIAEPEKFLAVFDGDTLKAEGALENVVRNAKNGVIGTHEFGDFISPDATKVKFEEMEKQMLEQIQKTTREKFGIEVQLCGLKQIGLTEQVTADVFKRMKAERERLVKKYTAEGEARALEIRSEANLKKEQVIAAARGQATRILGEAEAVVSQAYNTLEKDPELAKFLFELRALTDVLKEKSTIIGDPSMAPFNQLLLDPAKGPAVRSTNPR